MAAKTEQIERKFTGRVIAVDVETVILPNGHRTDLELIQHPGGAAAVVLDEQNRVCLLRQYRHAAGDWLWELPAGKIEQNEAPLLTAQRELAEEAGVHARQWQELGPIFSSPGVFREVIHLYLARDITPTQVMHEAAEVIEIGWINFEQAIKWAISGEITDAKTLIGLFRVASAVDVDQ